MICLNLEAKLEKCSVGSFAGGGVSEQVAVMQRSRGIPDGKFIGCTLIADRLLLLVSASV